MNRKFYGILLILLVFISCKSVWGAQYHSGNIFSDETWTLVNSPHYITADVNVDGATLTIEAGCTVYFNIGTRLQITTDAKLLAQGTSGNHIIFTSSSSTPSKGDWNNIKFYDLASGYISELSYCDISYGGSDGTGMIENFQYDFDSLGYVNVYNCTLSSSSNYGIYLRSYFDSSPAITPAISSNTFAWNDSYPIIIADDRIPITQFPQYLNNTFIGNGEQTVGIGNSASIRDVRRSGTLENPGIPYTIIGNLDIDDNFTLTIEEGTELKVAAGKAITVYGTLLAQGQPGQEIKFTAVIPGNPWNYIRFENLDDADGSILDYCIIEYAGSSGNGAVSIYNSGAGGDDGGAPKISNCIIRDSSSYGIKGQNASSVNSISYTIANSTITDCTSYGIYLYTDSSSQSTTPAISSNTITNCTYPLALYGSSFPTYLNNNFSGCDNVKILFKGSTINDSGTLKKPGSYYYSIGGDLTVSSGDTLTIDPGVILKFQAQKELIINGTLLAVGTPGNMITFTSDAISPGIGDWDDIKFNNVSNKDSILDYCLVEYGGRAGYGEIYVFDNGSGGYPAIRHSTITLSGDSVGNPSYGIYYYNNGTAVNLTPEVSSTTITDTSYPIYVSGASSNFGVRHFPVCWNNNISNNTYNGIVYGGGSTEYIRDNGSWDYTEYPYFVLTMVYINADTLTINPGVTVKFGAAEGFIISDTGRIDAQGTESNPVTFTSAQASPAPGYWDCIEFNDVANTNSILSYCDIKYGGSGGEGEIKIYNNTQATDYYPQIYNCNISSSLNYGIYLYNAGIQNLIYTPIISSNTITGTSYPIYLNADSDGIKHYPVLSSNTFINNTYDGIGIAGVNIGRNMTWDYSHPYIIDGDVTVPAGKILTIDPGTVLKFNSQANLIVSGTLDARGTGSEKITFTSSQDTPTTGYWGNIKFNDVINTNSILDYCQVEYGGYGTKGEIYIYNDSNSGYPKISNSTITLSSNYGIYYYNTGASITNLTPEVSSTTITNTSWPVYVYGYSTDGIRHFPVYWNNTFTNNTYDGIAYYGTYIRDSGTWDYTEYPYFILNNITIDNANTLTISPGVTVKFDSGYGLTIKATGRIDAQGTESNRITFTSNQATPAAGYWGNIKFEDVANNSSVLDYCDIAYGGYGGYGMIYVYNSSIASDYAPSIFNCNISSCSSYGIYFNNAGNQNTAYTSDLSSNTITNTTYPVYISGTNSLGYGIKHFPVYTNNVFANNTYNGIGIAGTRLGIDGAFSLTDYPYILNGRLTIPSGKTLTIDPGAVLKFMPGANLKAEGTLLAQGQDSSAIVFTSIKDDAYIGDTNSDAGATAPAAGDWETIHFAGTGSNSSILEKCIIKYAGEYYTFPYYYAGIIIEGDSAVTATAPGISSSTISDIKGDSIYAYTNSSSYKVDPTIEFSNIIPDAATTYLVYYDGTPDIIAENNWWDSDPPDSGKFSGNIDYTPWLSSGPGTPAAPTGFTGVVLSTFSIKWSWQDNAADEDRYYLHDAGHSIKATLSAGATSYIEEDLSASTQYTRHSNAFSDFADTDSNSASIYTYANTPASLTALSASSGTVTLSWSGDGTRYAVERKPSAGDSYSFIVQWSDSLSATGYTDTGLTPETTYFYRVKAYNGDQEITGSSNEISKRTSLYAPSGFSGTALSSASIKWSWSDNSNIETGYRVHSSTHQDLSGELGIGAVTWTESAAFLPNTQYTRHANASDSLGDSDSNSDSAYTWASVPVNLTKAAASSGTITFSWSGDGTRYSIEQATDGVSYSFIVQWSDSLSTTTYAVSSLNVGTTYWFRIYSYNAEGTINPVAGEQAFQTLSGAPDTPTDTGDYTNSSTMTFTWSQGSAGSGVTSYYLQVGTSTDFGGTIFDADIGNVLQKDVPGGEDEKTYYARVRAKTSSVYGSWSGNSDGITVDLTIPGSPAVTSTTHPDSSKNYANNDPYFSWTLPSDFSGIAGYYYLLDSSSNTAVTSSNGTYITDTSMSFTDKADAAWWFHVAARDGAGNIGDAVHFKVNIKTIIKANEDNIVESDNVIIEIPSGAVDSDKTIEISVPDPAKLPSVINDPRISPTDIVREISFTDNTKKFNKDITITIYYTDLEIAGITESLLRMFYWDEGVSIWQLIPGSTVYPGENKVEAKIDHLSLFRIMTYSAPTEVVSGLTNIPNPFSPMKSATTKVRYWLKADYDVSLKIFDLIGDLVLEEEFTAGDLYANEGLNGWVWDGKNANGSYVGMGAYICMIEVEGKREIIKIGVK